MPNRRRKYTAGHAHLYKRRSQVYRRLRTRKLAQGQYIVQHEPSSMEFYVFKREEDWAVTPRSDKGICKGGFRTKDLAMEALERQGPRVVA